MEWLAHSTLILSGGSRISQTVPQTKRMGRKPIVWPNFYKQLHDRSSTGEGVRDLSPATLDQPINLTYLLHNKGLYTSSEIGSESEKNKRKVKYVKEKIFRHGRNFSLSVLLSLVVNGCLIFDYLPCDVLWFQDDVEGILGLRSTSGDVQSEVERQAGQAVISAGVSVKTSMIAAFFYGASVKIFRQCNFTITPNKTCIIHREEARPQYILSNFITSFFNYSRCFYLFLRL